ncbi:hypothetical protein ABGF26_02580 [Helcococcus ovis]|uniref:hypothetical protein n=1 Tax=Helcococcus ovis TaxID=72026 RepID=UPI0038BAF826
MEDLKSQVEENRKAIQLMQITQSEHDTTLRLMQKDYEYMKKGLDDITRQGDSNFNVLNAKLDDIYKLKSKEKENELQEFKNQVKEIKDIKGYIIKALLAALVLGAFYYLFPFLKR